MNNVRAYNMNPNDLIKTNSGLVDNHNTVLKDAQKIISSGKETKPEVSVSANDPVVVDISPAWQKVASNIDLKNANADEVASMSSALFQAKAISFEDHVSLSFQKNPLDDSKSNFIDYWSERQETAVLQGAAHEELNDIIRIQSILGYVDSLGE
ncbi:MAG: hypothetical protein HOH19_00415 [Kordiimonadaceae bacterium]|nr:hypothetical protein [Kordiimonadaceae bacterium]MBT6031011.1 hypothetical protein [Kordiimonadaceae bacterium]